MALPPLISTHFPDMRARGCRCVWVTWAGFCSWRRTARATRRRAAHRSSVGRGRAARRGPRRRRPSRSVRRRLRLAATCQGRSHAHNHDHVKELLRRGAGSHACDVHPPNAGGNRHPYRRRRGPTSVGAALPVDARPGAVEALGGGRRLCAGRRGTRALVRLQAARLVRERARVWGALAAPALRDERGTRSPCIGAARKRRIRRGSVSRYDSGVGRSDGGID